MTDNDTRFGILIEKSRKNEESQLRAEKKAEKSQLETHRKLDILIKTIPCNVHTEQIKTLKKIVYSSIGLWFSSVFIVVIGLIINEVFL